MATKKISELTAATSVTGIETIALVQEGATKKTTLNTVLGQVSTHILPTVDSNGSTGFDLGSATKRFRDLYLSQATIYLGNTTSFSGTTINVAASPEEATTLANIPTIIASKFVAKPYTYNPGGGGVTVRPSIEFQDTGNNSYPISFDTAAFEFSFDAPAGVGKGSVKAKKGTFANTDAGGVALIVDDGKARFDGAVQITSTGTLAIDANTASTDTTTGAVVVTGGMGVGGSLYVGGTISATSLTATGAVTLGDGNDNVTLNGGGSNPVVITGSNFTVAANGNVTVGGNLTVQGTTTTINSNTLAIGDNTIYLNNDWPNESAPTENAGFTVNRGSEADVSWLWNETGDYWDAGAQKIGNVGTPSNSSDAATKGYVDGHTQTITLSGDASGTGTTAITVTLPNVNTSGAGTYNSLTVNAKGLVTAATNVSYAAVATSGSYNDLLNKPTLFDGNYNSLTNKPVLATVATSGSYTDLSDKPTIPTTTSQLTNDSGFITGNQNITVSGDATGSGTTAITLTLANSGVSANTYRSVTVNAKGLVTGGTNPTTLSGYGITDAVATSRTISAGTGLTGGGDLSANRTLSADIATQAQMESQTANKLVTADGVKFAPAAAKAWAIWDGGNTGTYAPIAGFNVASITRNSLGNYSVNFSTAMSNAFYVVVANGDTQGFYYVITRGTTSCQVVSRNTADSANFDPNRINVAIYGDH